MQSSFDTIVKWPAVQESDYEFKSHPTELDPKANN